MNRTIFCSFEDNSKIWFQVVKMLITAFINAHYPEYSKLKFSSETFPSSDCYDYCVHNLRQYNLHPEEEFTLDMYCEILGVFSEEDLDAHMQAVSDKDNDKKRVLDTFFLSDEVPDDLKDSVSKYVLTKEPPEYQIAELQALLDDFQSAQKNPKSQLKIGGKAQSAVITVVVVEIKKKNGDIDGHSKVIHMTELVKLLRWYLIEKKSLLTKNPRGRPKAASKDAKAASEDAKAASDAIGGLSDLMGQCYIEPPNIMRDEAADASDASEENNKSCPLPKKPPQRSTRNIMKKEPGFIYY